MVGLVRGGIKIITILNRGQLHNNNIIVIYNDGYQGIWEYKKNADERAEFGRHVTRPYAWGDATSRNGTCSSGSGPVNVNLMNLPYAIPVAAPIKRDGA